MSQSCPNCSCSSSSFAVPKRKSSAIKRRFASAARLLFHCFSNHEDDFLRGCPPQNDKSISCNIDYEKKPVLTYSTFYETGVGTEITEECNDFKEEIKKSLRTTELLANRLDPKSKINTTVLPDYCRQELYHELQYTVEKMKSLLSKLNVTCNSGDRSKDYPKPGIPKTRNENFLIDKRMHSNTLSEDERKYLCLNKNKNLHVEQQVYYTALEPSTSSVQTCLQNSSDDSVVISSDKSEKPIEVILSSSVEKELANFLKRNSEQTDPLNGFDELLQKIFSTAYNNKNSFEIVKSVLTKFKRTQDSSSESSCNGLVEDVLFNKCLTSEIQVNPILLDASESPLYNQKSQNSLANSCTLSNICCGTEPYDHNFESSDNAGILLKDQIIQLNNVEISKAKDKAKYYNKKELEKNSKATHLDTIVNYRIVNSNKHLKNTSDKSSNKSKAQSKVTSKKNVGTDRGIATQCIDVQTDSIEDTKVTQCNSEDLNEHKVANHKSVSTQDVLEPFASCSFTKILGGGCKEIRITTVPVPEDKASTCNEKLAEDTTSTYNENLQNSSQIFFTISRKEECVKSLGDIIYKLYSIAMKSAQVNVKELDDSFKPKEVEISLKIPFKDLIERNLENTDLKLIPRNSKQSVGSLTTEKISKSTSTVFKPATHVQSTEKTTQVNSKKLKNSKLVILSSVLNLPENLGSSKKDLPKTKHQEKAHVATFSSRGVNTSMVSDPDSEKELLGKLFSNITPKTKTAWIQTSSKHLSELLTPPEIPKAVWSNASSQELAGLLYATKVPPTRANWCYSPSNNVLGASSAAKKPEMKTISSQSQRDPMFYQESLLESRLILNTDSKKIEASTGGSMVDACVSTSSKHITDSGLKSKPHKSKKLKRRPTVISVSYQFPEHKNEDCQVVSSSTDVISNRVIKNSYESNACLYFYYSKAAERETDS